MGVEDGRWNSGGGGGYKTEKGATWYETLKEAYTTSLLIPMNLWYT
jgi:hypothetical protein